MYTSIHLSINLSINNSTPLLYAYIGLGPNIGPRGNQRLHHGQVATIGTRVEGCPSRLYIQVRGKEGTHNGSEQRVSLLYTRIYICRPKTRPRMGTHQT